MKRNSAINLFMSFLLISQSVPETFGVQAFASSISETTQKNDTKRKDSSDTQARSVTASKNESLVRVADKQSRLTTFDNRALMSRLWTGFFGTGRYRTPKIFQNPDFSLKRRDFWVFL